MAISLARVEPASTLALPEDYVERVKASHESGCDGSIGYVCLSVSLRCWTHLLIVRPR